MKRLYAVLCALLLIPVWSRADGCDCCGDATSKSYLYIRPLGHSVGPEYIAQFRADSTWAREEDGYNGAIQAVLYGSKTTNGDRRGRYFLPFCQPCVVFGEEINFGTGSVPGYNDFNILATNFNVYTKNGDFLSTVCLDPQQSVIGFNLHYRQSFLQCEDKGRGFWGSILLPIQRVKNNLNFCENVINDGGGVDETQNEFAYANLTQAFMQSDWLYGKICVGAMHETKVADMEFKLGYEWLQWDPCHMETYIGILVPTGNTPNGKFLFEPVVGFGKQWGVMFGSATGIHLCRWEEHNMEFRVEYAMHSQYLFSKKQRRSIDLKGKPWSRYLPVYTSQEQALQAEALGSVNAATPGINVFTPVVKVKPNFQFNMTTALVVEKCNFHIEAGYNFYIRRGECLELDCGFPSEVALKDIAGGGFTNPIRDITGNPLLEVPGFSIDANNYQRSVITINDLDFDSAATPAVLNYTIYGCLGYDFDWCNYPMFVNGGGSYEFGNDNNAAIDRWVIWIKSGISF